MDECCSSQASDGSEWRSNLIAIKQSNDSSIFHELYFTTRNLEIQRSTFGRLRFNRSRSSIYAINQSINQRTSIVVPARPCYCAWWTEPFVVLRLTMPSHHSMELVEYPTTTHVVVVPILATYSWASCSSDPPSPHAQRTPRHSASLDSSSSTNPSNAPSIPIDIQNSSILTHQARPSISLSPSLLLLLSTSTANKWSIPLTVESERDRGR